MPTRPRVEPKTAEPEPTEAPAMQRTMLFARRDRTARAAREFVAEALTQWGCRERLDDIRLCTSELVTNALRHGAPSGRLILVRLELHDTQVLVEVHDSGDGKPTPRQAQDTHDISDDGRGLLLISAIADDWGVTPRRGPGKRVWASFQVQSESL